MECLDQGVMVIDRARRVAISNPRAIELMELPPELMASRPRFEDVLAHQWNRDKFTGSDPEFRSFVERALMLDGPRVYRRKRPNGKVLEVRTTSLPDGSAVRTFSDVTEHHNALQALDLAKERADGSDRAKAEFLAHISHELRTPLNAIIGFSELIRDQINGPLPTVYVGYADDIHASGVQLLHMINDLIQLSKLEAGRFDLSEEKLKLSPLLELCIRRMMTQAAAAEVGITLDATGTNVTLQIDRRAVHQVLLNLLSNAVRSSPAGSDVTVSVEETSEDGIAILVTRPQTAGQAAGTLLALEPFREEESPSARDFQATGLGLAITRKLMVLHGGSLDITADGEGRLVAKATFPAARIVRLTPVTTEGVPL